MFWAFIKKCRFPDGRLDFYAHVVIANGIGEAKRKVEDSFRERNVWGTKLKSRFPNAILEELIEYGSSEESQNLYEKACKRVFNLSEKAKGQAPVVQKQIIQASVVQKNDPLFG